MADWFSTARAIVTGAFRQPTRTTLVVKDRETGKVSARKVDQAPPPEEPDPPAPRE